MNLRIKKSNREVGVIYYTYIYMCVCEREKNEERLNVQHPDSVEVKKKNESRTNMMNDVTGRMVFVEFSRKA